MLRTGDMLKDVMLDILGCRISILMFEYMVVRLHYYMVELHVENASLIKGFHNISTAVVQIHHAEVWKGNSR